jgi:hypothetical protein
MKVRVGAIRRIVREALHEGTVNEAVSVRGKRQLRYADLRPGMKVLIGIVPHDLYKAPKPKKYDLVTITGVQPRAGVPDETQTSIDTDRGSHRYKEYEYTAGGPSHLFYAADAPQAAPKAPRGTR